MTDPLVQRPRARTVFVLALASGGVAAVGAGAPRTEAARVRPPQGHDGLRCRGGGFGEPGEGTAEEDDDTNDGLS